MLTSQLNIEFEQLNFQSPILGPFFVFYRSLKTIWQNENVGPLSTKFPVDRMAFGQS